MLIEKGLLVDLGSVSGNVQRVGFRLRLCPVQHLQELRRLGPHPENDELEVSAATFSRKTLGRVPIC